MHTSTSKDKISIRQELLRVVACGAARMRLLKNQVKVVGEREILASLVEFKHHLMAETIRNEKEEKKLKPRRHV